MRLILGATMIDIDTNHLLVYNDNILTCHIKEGLMPAKTIQNSPFLANAIRDRRKELGLTIEEAAKRAGVGIKTWCRYEVGESIRVDKCKGICKALNWRTLPIDDDAGSESSIIDEYRNSKNWSKYLEYNFGSVAALSFAVGCEILGDHLYEDMTELSRKPKGSHVGEISTSFLVDDLPPQFLTRYDYEFYYALRCTLNKLKSQAQLGGVIIAHSVLEELTLYLIVEESRLLLEDGDYVFEDGWDEWIFELLEDDDLIYCLYSDTFLTPDDSYHFDHWMERQFYENK